MPADSISPLSRGNGPAVYMETLDHYQTASWGPSNAARAYRAAKADSIAQSGGIDDAMQMDINDIHSQFGSKYCQGILDLIDSLGDEPPC